MLLLHPSDLLLFFSGLCLVSQFVNTCLGLSVLSTLTWSSPFPDNVGLCLTHELAKVPSLYLLVLELLHDLVPHIVRFGREHLGLVLLAVELPHRLLLVLCQFFHFQLSKLLSLLSCEFFDFSHVHGVPQVVIHVVFEALLLAHANLPADLTALSALPGLRRRARSFLLAA